MGLKELEIEKQAVGYHIIRIEEGYMALVGIPFGIKTNSGQYESLSNDVINEVYLNQLGLMDNKAIDFFEFDLKEANATLHIGVPRNIIKSRLWSDILTAKRYLITLLVDGRPQVLNAEWVTKIHNVITIMTNATQNNT